jgi:hypothetical protein
VDLKQQYEWLRRVLGHGGGYLSYAERELGSDVVFDMMSVDDEPGAVQVLEHACAFVLRCLANPRCEGSDQVLGALLEARGRA